MFQKIRHSRAGFTLMEMLIVLTIVGILMGFSMLPYGDFMDRARLSNTIDTISQEWILAHKEVRNGKEFPQNSATASSGTAVDESSHATIVLEMEIWKNSIKKYLYKAPKWTDEQIDLTQIGNDFRNPNHDPDKIVLESNINFERGAEILSFAEANGDEKAISSWINGEKMYYVITPPYATGTFYDKDFAKKDGKQQTIIIGQNGAKYAISRAKEVFLRAYLQ